VLRFDAIILGAGYTGPLLATVLGRQGYRVALVETAPLPRVAIGESSTPEQTRLHAWLARRWGIPELLPLSSYYRMKRSHLPIAVWPKESFYFLAHPTRVARTDFNPGRPPELLYQTPPWPIGPDMHLFRADLDTYLLSLAVRSGACLFGMAKIDELDLSGPVRLRLGFENQEARIEAPVLFDCSGFGSQLASDLGLRVSDPPEITLRARAVYNHFVGTRGLEATYGSAWPRLPIPRDHATVHFVWPEGWSWFIPFDNGITSVGILVNQELPGCADAEPDAAAEFWRRGNTHPAFEAMMAGARAIRPWTATGRLQWRTSQVIGDNWILLPPSSGFTDPLFSSGMSMSAVAVSRIAERSHDILGRGVAPARALPDYGACYFREIEYIGRIQHLFYLAATDLELLAAALEIYRMGTLLGGVATAIPGVHPHLQPLWGSGHGVFREIVDAAHQLVREGRAGSGEPADVAAKLRALTREREPWGFTRSKINHPTIPNVHVFPALEMYRFLQSLGLGRDWVGRMFESLRDGFVSPTGRGAARRAATSPNDRDLFGLIHRHLRILLGL
jgi:FADH2 O2-dependent halogenase